VCDLSVGAIAPNALAADRVFQHRIGLITLAAGSLCIAYLVLHRWETSGTGSNRWPPTL
jgi:hypothetical protein